MLHEVLIALSGYPSPIFDGKLDEIPNVTAAERALLESTGRLAKLHRALRSHLQRIVSFHPSAVCRAVASTIVLKDLARFQQLILDVEKEILSKSPTVVGAYNIVPLSGIVSRFEPWRRILEWFWANACFMLSSNSRPTARDDAPNLREVCSGTALIDRLLKDTLTGYEDVEEVALRLCKVAEQAWLRQLSLLLLMSRPQRESCPDLFLANEENNNFGRRSNIPPFVTDDAARSLSNICKTLEFFEASQTPEHSVFGQDLGNKSPLSIDIRRSLLPHVEKLSVLTENEHPITAYQFSHSVNQIRTYISTKVTEEILPISRLLHLLRVLNSFFLGQRIEFLDALILESDKHLRSRHVQANVDLQRTDLRALAGAMIKEAEVQTVLARTWPAVITTSGMFGELDTDVEWARTNLTLRLALNDDANDEAKNNEEQQKPKSRDEFNDFLLSVPVIMGLKNSATFSLFLASSEMDIYDSIRAYFSALRRTHNHIKDMWRESTQRKTHPAPIGPPRSNTERGRAMLRRSRNKLQSRQEMMRLPWHVSSWVVILLNEVWDYFWGEVVHNSWSAFYAWANKIPRPATPSSRPSSSKVSNPRQSFMTQYSSAADRTNESIPFRSDGEQSLPHDPIVLGEGHQEYLRALHFSLLLEDDVWKSKMRRLLTQADNLVAVIHRLQFVQKQLDLQEEGVVENTKINYAKEEDETYKLVTAASKDTQAAAREVIRHLKKISDFEHVPSKNAKTTAGMASSEFEPWVQSNIDRLLLRLDMQIISHE